MIERHPSAAPLLERGFALATWNVNSINVRVPRILEFLEQHSPDVVCLQETKVLPDAFPSDVLHDAGYRAVDHSGGRWAGVAILAREGIEVTDVAKGLPGEPLPDDARWIEATIGGIRVASAYVINGRAVDDPMFSLKLEFLDAMAKRCADLSGRPLVVAGDFNIAPADIDVWDPERFLGSTHVTDEERSRFQQILDAGLLDAFRCVEPETVQHTWWDYRAGAFHRGHGLRIDLILASSDIAERITSCGMVREFRKGPKPSDHAPVLLEISGGAGDAAS